LDPEPIPIKNQNHTKNFLTLDSYFDLDPYQHWQKDLTGIVTAYVKCGTKTMPGLLQSVHPTWLPQDTHEYALRFEVRSETPNILSAALRKSVFWPGITSCIGIGKGCSTIGAFLL
jgi:hypothetical protein